MKKRGREGEGEKEEEPAEDRMNSRRGTFRAFKSPLHLSCFGRGRLLRRGELRTLSEIPYKIIVL